MSRTSPSPTPGGSSTSTTATPPSRPRTAFMGSVSFPRADLAAQADAVQDGGQRQIAADDEEQFEELRGNKRLGQEAPRAVAHLEVVDHLVHRGQERTLLGGPDRVGRSP